MSDILTWRYFMLHHNNHHTSAIHVTNLYNPDTGKVYVNWSQLKPNALFQILLLSSFHTLRWAEPRIHCLHAGLAVSGRHPHSSNELREKHFQPPADPLSWQRCLSQAKATPGPPLLCWDAVSCFVPAVADHPLHLSPSSRGTSPLPSSSEPSSMAGVSHTIMWDMPELVANLSSNLVNIKNKTKQILLLQNANSFFTLTSSY